MTSPPRALLLLLIPLAAWAQPAGDGISEAEKIRRSGEAVTRMRDVLKDSLKKLQDARSSNDVVKLNCVNEKLTQIKGLLRVSEQADVALQEAVARRESTTTDKEFSKVTLAGQKVDLLRTEVESCIGQLAFRTDDQQVIETTEPSYLPQWDPALPVTQEPVTSRAPASSPTL